jgi:hypothetical protein
MTQLAKNEIAKRPGLALDRATVRTVDKDGRLHVEVTHISKANVCPYFGREIPRWEELGLDPDRIYQLLRDPGELAKAAATFNNLPLLCEHVPHSAEDPIKELVIGATGSDAEFKDPYLNNSLVVWDATYIGLIDSHEQKELSSSYYYDADMTPGVYEGVPYDGRMINIVGNHVALVKVGRAGADVAVSDSLPSELDPMKKKHIAVAISAALGAYLRPALAQDSIPQLRDLTRGNKTPAQIAADAKALFGDKVDEPKLAGLLKTAMDEAAEYDDTADDEDDEKDKKDDKAKDEDEDDKDKKAKDETDEDGKDKGKKDDKAMDSASILAKARDQARAESRALRQAERDVASIVGELPAMDSAEEVYRYALDQLKVDHKGVHASALPAMVRLAKDRAPAAQKTESVAMDAESVDSFDKRFPNRAPLRSV